MAMRDMVKRDRNHPSVIVWSFCNEYECTQNDANFSALAFRRAALSIDSTRPLTANDATFGDFDALDVQGFSHSNNATLDAFHAQRPYEATVLSEVRSYASSPIARLPPQLTSTLSLCLVLFLHESAPESFLLLQSAPVHPR